MLKNAMSLLYLLTRFSADGQNIAQNCTTMKVAETMLYWTAASPGRRSATNPP